MFKKRPKWDFLPLNRSESLSFWSGEIKAVYRSTDDLSQLWRDFQPGKIEYDWRYFIMTFRTRIHKKIGRNGFHTLHSTISHRPWTLSSSLKIAAAYRIRLLICIPAAVAAGIAEARSWAASAGWVGGTVRQDQGMDRPSQYKPHLPVYSPPANLVRTPCWTSSLRPSASVALPSEQALSWRAGPTQCPAYSLA
jgi:hypothetical protein